LFFFFNRKDLYQVHLPQKATRQPFGWRTSCGARFEAETKVQQKPAGVEGAAFCITWIIGSAASLMGYLGKV